MYLDIGDKITAISIKGNNVTGNITAILENTVILFCGLEPYLVLKKDLEKQGYKLPEVEKHPKSIVISSNRNIKTK